MAAVTICSDFRTQENKVFNCFHCFPIYLPWNDGTGSWFFECWVLSQFSSLSSFSFIKSLFSSSLLPAIRVVLSPYLRLLTFLLAILIPTCVSSRPAIWMMYSAYQFNKQGDNTQRWRTPFSISNQSPVLTVASWLASRFLRR